MGAITCPRAVLGKAASCWSDYTWVRARQDRHGTDDEGHQWSAAPGRQDGSQREREREAGAGLLGWTRLCSHPPFAASHITQRARRWAGASNLPGQVLPLQSHAAHPPPPPRGNSGLLHVCTRGSRHKAQKENGSPVAQKTSDAPPPPRPQPAPHPSLASVPLSTAGRLFRTHGCGDTHIHTHAHAHAHPHSPLRGHVP